MPLAIAGRLSNKFALESGPSRVKLLSEIAAFDPTRRADVPLNLTLLIDRSTSMMGDALDSVKAAALRIVDSLASTDSLGIVGFDATVDVIVANQNVGDRSAMKTAIEKLSASGATNIHEALTVGHREAMRHFAADKLNRMLLLSDGEATAGETREASILAQADQIAADGVPISTLGVGDEYDEVLLSEMARRAGGNHYFIQSPSDVGRVFDQEMGRVRRVIAKNLVLTVTPGPGARLAMLNERYATRPAGETLAIRLDEQEADRPQYAILDLTVPPAEPGCAVWARLDLSYDDLLEGMKSQTVSAELSLEHVADGQRIREGIDRDVLRRWEELSAAQQLRSLVERVRDGKIDAKTAVMSIDRQTQELVKRKSMALARTFAQVGKTIAEEGRVPTSLSKTTMVTVEEAQKGAAGRTMVGEK